MRKSHCRLAIGLPVYNGGRFLSRTLESLLGQSFEDFRLVISDNASCDETEEICRSYSSMDSRITYVRQAENLGAAKNYNHVFHGCSGEYFKWHACDDILAPEFLDRCIEILDERPEVNLAYTRSQLVDVNDAPLKLEEDALELNSPDVRRRFASCLSAMKICHNPFFGIIRRDILARTRLKASYLAADRCLMAELALYGPFYQVPERLFLRRKHPQSVSASREYLEFFDPSLKNKIVLPEWRVGYEHMRSINLAPLALKVKIALYLDVLRWTFRKRRTLFAQLAVAGEQYLQTIWTAERLPGKLYFVRKKQVTS